MTSPFDLAAAHPVLDEPSKKKWNPSTENSSEPYLMAFSNNNVSMIGGGGSGGTNMMIPINKSGIVILSPPSPTASSFDAFNDIDLEDGRTSCRNNNPVPTNNMTTIPFNIDTICIPGDTINNNTNTRRLSDISCDGSSYTKKITGT